MHVDDWPVPVKWYGLLKIKDQNTRSRVSSLGCVQRSLMATTGNDVCGQTAFQLCC